MAREDIRIIYICKRCLNEDQRIIEINETEEEQYSYPHKCCSFCHSQDYVRTSYIFDVEGKFYHHKDYKNVKILVKSLRRQPEFNRELYNKRNENNKTISKSDSLRFWIGSLIMCLGIIAAVICGLTIGKGGMGISLLIAVGGAFLSISTKTANEVEKHNKPTTSSNSSSIPTSSKPKCPTCGSTNIKDISTLNRAVSVGMFGLASSKIGKTKECKDCGYKW